MRFRGNVWSAALGRIPKGERLTHTQVEFLSLPRKFFHRVLAGSISLCFQSWQRADSYPGKGIRYRAQLRQMLV